MPWRCAAVSNRRTRADQLPAAAFPNAAAEFATPARRSPSRVDRRLVDVVNAMSGEAEIDAVLDVWSTNARTAPAARRRDAPTAAADAADCRALRARERRDEMRQAMLISRRKTRSIQNAVAARSMPAPPRCAANASEGSRLPRPSADDE